MNRKFSIILLLFSLITSVGLFAEPAVSFAEDGSSNLPAEYELLTPLPLGEGGEVVPNVPLAQDSDDFGEFLNNLLVVLVAVAGGIAVVILIAGGIKIITSDSGTGKSQGKEYVKGAIFGLLLVLGSFVLLNTINPDILSIRALDPLEIEIFSTPKEAGWYSQYIGVSGTETIPSQWEPEYKPGQYSPPFATEAACNNWRRELEQRTSEKPSEASTPCVQVNPDTVAWFFRTYSPFDGPIPLLTGKFVLHGPYTSEEQCSAAQESIRVELTNVGEDLACFSRECESCADFPSTIPQKEDLCGGDRNCKANARLINTLTQFQEIRADGWQIGGAWPPKAFHDGGQGNCYNSGHCVWGEFTDEATWENVSAFIQDLDTAKFFYKIWVPSTMRIRLLPEDPLSKRFGISTGSVWFQVGVDPSHDPIYYSPSLGSGYTDEYAGEMALLITDMIENSEDEIRERLAAARIKVSNSGDPLATNPTKCTRVTQSGCTNVGYLSEQAISGVIALKEACDAWVKKPVDEEGLGLSGEECEVVITGGTEWWAHGGGQPNITKNSSRHKPIDDKTREYISDYSRRDTDGTALDIRTSNGTLLSAFLEYMIKKEGLPSPSPFINGNLRWYYLNSFTGSPGIDGYLDERNTKNHWHIEFGKNPQ